MCVQETREDNDKTISSLETSSEIESEATKPESTAESPQVESEIPEKTEPEFSKPVVNVSSIGFHQKYDEDVIVQTEDVFISGLSLDEGNKFESSPITVQEAIVSWRSNLDGELSVILS